MIKHRKSFYFMTLLTAFIAFSQVQPAWCEFNPPKDIEIERTWTMIAFGESIGVIRSIRTVDDSQGKILIKDVFESQVGTGPGVQMNAKETIWLNEKGLKKLDFSFKETDKQETYTMKGDLNEKTNLLTIELKSSDSPQPYNVEFMKNQDYHWSTSYIAFNQLNLEEVKKYKRKILDIYDLTSRDVEVEYLGMEKVEQAGHTLDCHIIKFDYGTIKGTFWLAEDELGYFLVKEHAKAEGQPFQMFMDEYTKRPVSKGNAPKDGNDGFGF